MKLHYLSINLKCLLPIFSPVHSRHYCATVLCEISIDWPEINLPILIAIVVFADTCHKMKFADAVKCPAFTKMQGYCIVDRASSFGICAETPGCKYVLTTTDTEWNAVFPNVSMLGKDPLTYNSQWTSCEFPTTTGLEIADNPDKGIPETGTEGEAEMFGQGILKLVNERITSEGANVTVRKGRSEGDSRFAQKLQHKDMMGAMQEVKPSHL